jgi:hypothetical protein
MTNRMISKTEDWIKKWLFSFLLPFHSCAPSIFISYCCLYQCQAVLLLYAGAHKISLKYLFLEKMFIEICCQKCHKCKTIWMTTFFVKFLQILCSSCIRLILVYSLVVLGEGDGGSIRDDQILQFFPQT